MSLARTALRVSVKEGLLADPVIAVLCDGRIFDSRISELDELEPVPVIVILTEDDSGHAYSANDGGPPFDERCELLIEIAMRCVTSPPGPAGTDPVLMINLVETDREMEAVLDFLEHRVILAITQADTPQSRLIRNSVTRRVNSYRSVRFASDETSMKLAMRTTHLSVQLRGDDRTNVLNPPTGPFAALPNPLRTVAEALPEGSSGLTICRMLAAALSGDDAAIILMTDIAPFGGADITVAPRQQIEPGTPPFASAPGPHFGVKADPDHL